MPPTKALMRIAAGAQLVPATDHARWLDQAFATPGLTLFDRKVLAAIAAHDARVCRGSAAKLSIEGLAFESGRTTSKRISAAIARLIAAGWLAVRNGNGARPSDYLMCLPARTMVTAAVAAQQEAACPLT